ncbi:DUF1189 domain-containing protein [Alteribacillus sp. YIM 98480]|uniref:DUF1189 domain-containing protein n=1 Tax=Alteribacillus sp. YIM 98480 TaxID=2606599 RepID=UPI00131E2993|nr:DUF1189 domain-containing protein [Alteribacillus sp. YIM 98480]
MNIFQKFIKSLYSPTFIGRFRFQGIGKTIGYVFFLMLLTSIPVSVLFTNTIFSTANKVENALSEEIPDFQLQNGQLHSEQNDPQIYEHENETIVFDATGEITREDIEQEENTTALLREEVVIAEDGTIQTFRYDQAGNIQLSKDDIITFADTLSGLFPILIPVVLVLLYLFSTALKFIGIFALTLFGLLIKKAAPIRLTYRQIWIICAYTVTLPTVISALIDVMPFQLPFAFTLYWAIAFFMLYNVYKNLPKPKNTESE